MKRKIALTLAGLVAGSGLMVTSTGAASAVIPIYRNTTCDSSVCWIERSNDNGRSWTMIGWHYRTVPQ